MIKHKMKSLRNYLGGKFSSQLLAGSILVSSFLPNLAKSENSILEVGASSYHDEPAAFVEANYSPLTKDGKLSLQARVSSNSDLNAGLVLRQDPHGYSGFGANAFFNTRENGSSGNAGLEYFRKKDRALANAYFGDVSGLEAAYGRDLIDNEKGFVSLLAGVYSLKDESQDSTGVRLGLRGERSLGNNLDFFVKGDVYTDETFTGSYSVEAYLKYSLGKGKKQKHRIVEMLNLIRPTGEEIIETPNYEIEETPSNGGNNDPEDPENPENPGVTGDDGNGGPVGNSGITGDDGTDQGGPVGNGL